MDQHPTPQPGECVLCFTARAVAAAGCDGTLRWLTSHREATAPDAVGAERRLARRGEPCDGRVVADGWQLARPALERDVHSDELAAPDPPPPCAGVRPGSSRPCRLWELRGRGVRGVVVGAHGPACGWPPPTWP